MNSAETKVPNAFIEQTKAFFQGGGELIESWIDDLTVYDMKTQKFPWKLLMNFREGAQFIATSHGNVQFVLLPSYENDSSRVDLYITTLGQIPRDGHDPMNEFPVLRVSINRYFVDPYNTILITRGMEKHIDLLDINEASEDHILTILISAVFYKIGLHSVYVGSCGHTHNILQE